MGDKGSLSRAQCSVLFWAFLQADCKECPQEYYNELLSLGKGFKDSEASLYDSVCGDLETDGQQTDGDLETDGQQTDGDLETDGQQTDGDLETDGQQTDGDLETDGQQTDGDLETDGQQTDGDLETDGQQTDGDLETDGQQTDGDLETDGQQTDGDLETDGQQTDGDLETDGQQTDGDLETDGQQTDGDLETDGHLSTRHVISLEGIEPSVDVLPSENIQQVAAELREIAAQLEFNVVARATQNLTKNILGSSMQHWKEYLHKEVHNILTHGVGLDNLHQERVVAALAFTLVKGVCLQAPSLIRSLFDTTMQYLTHGGGR